MHALSHRCPASRIGLGFIAAAACAAPASAFDSLVVFGDSLSDVGNVQARSMTLAGLGLPVPPTPGPSYFNGRFSNGPNFIDNLSAGLGLGASVPSTGGGLNFAHGGAQTSGTIFPTTLIVDDLDVQVGNYLTATPAADPAGLFVVYGGANDFASGQTNPAVPAMNVAADVGRLADAGARFVLVPNLPLLGQVPRFSGDAATAAGATALSLGFNATLSAALDGVEAAHPDLTLYRLDVAGLFAQVAADPAAFELENVADPAAPGLSPGDAMYDSSLIVSNPDQYLFWDELHPTRAGHALLGAAALAAVPEPASLTFLACSVLLLRRRAQ